MSFVRKRIVFDTSTLVGVILKPQSLPAQVYYHAAKHHLLLASDETVQELVEVLQRNKFDRFRKREERATALGFYLKLIEIVPVTQESKDCRDEKDNKFLSLALSASVDVLLSSDDDLLVLNPYKNVQILTARQYAEQYRLQS